MEVLQSREHGLQAKGCQEMVKLRRLQAELETETGSLCSSHMPLGSNAVPTCLFHFELMCQTSSWKALVSCMLHLHAFMSACR